MQSSSSVWSALTDIFVSPGAALRGVDEHKGWSWLPLLLLIGLTAGAMMLYFNLVDFDIMKAQYLDVVAAEVSPNEREAMEKFLTKTSMMATSVINPLVMYLLIFAFTALWLMLATKMDPENTHGYGDWFGFSCWIYFPNVLAALLLFAYVLVADPMPGMLDLNLLSLNNLLLDLEFGSTWYTLAESFSPMTFWSIFLAAVGIQAWTRIDAARAWVIAALPSVVIYGVWALILLLSN
ncbi:YIP1 family protein [Gallaecimonas sp. GXIMD4217]|uniref:YIP1 family protein n=1 Tax=Gallaecimonas sp. GXIMD4217 TaxID=3131927 RepID=UPI00311B349C